MIPAVDRRTLLTLSVLIIGAATLLYLSAGWFPTPDAPAVPDSLPAQLSDAAFWQIVTDFSEPDGYFRSDNLLSNEWRSQRIIPSLRKRVKPGGVYIGVGPEQNFTYIQALEPKIAFVVDIRRLNMLAHLLYKALFELSRDRSEFVSMLFSRPAPEYLTTVSSARTLFDAYGSIAPDPDYFEQNLERVLGHLTRAHGFALSTEDNQRLRYLYSAFYREGPALSYSFLGATNQIRLWSMPTYADLMVETDDEGRNWGFLAAEDQFRRVQAMQKKNLIIPIVGDFAGPKAIRAVGGYLKKHHATVSVFYTSNVEMYLFQDMDDWRGFYSNVEELPTNRASTFVRFVVNRRAYSFSRAFRDSPQMWSSIQEILQGVRGGSIRSYGHVVAASR
jgi:hypothetical protein